MSNANTVPAWRIVWTIATKDVLDALRNKTLASIVIGVLLMMLSGQALPWLAGRTSSGTVMIYEETRSEAVTALLKSEELSAWRAPSEDALFVSLLRTSTPALAVRLPAEIDTSTGHLSLVSYGPHWVAVERLEILRGEAETALSQALGIPVTVLPPERVYPGTEGIGPAMMARLNLILVIVMICTFLVPYLMLDEKETHTLDALLVSPVRMSQIVWGKALAGCLYGAVASAVVLVLNRSMIVRWDLAIAASTSLVLFSVAVGLLLGSICDHAQQLNLWAGGVIVLLLAPVFSDIIRATRWPAWLKAIILWLPTSQLAEAYQLSFGIESSWGEVWPYLAVALGVTILLLGGVALVLKRSDR